MASYGIYQLRKLLTNIFNFIAVVDPFMLIFRIKNKKNRKENF